MQVYDRVIPAQSYPTLYVLSTGVLVAVLFGFLLREARTGNTMDPARQTRRYAHFRSRVQPRIATGAATVPSPARRGALFLNCASWNRFAR